jgi:hypothetical protein
VNGPSVAQKLAAPGVTTPLLATVPLVRLMRM